METNEKRICGAKKRKSDEICRALPMRNGRCRLHGGKSLKGFGHPKFKNGLFSKYMKLFPIDNKFEIKDFVQMVATIFNIIVRNVDFETAQKIQDEIEGYYQQLKRVGVRLH